MGGRALLGHYALLSLVLCQLYCVKTERAPLGHVTGWFTWFIPLFWDRREEVCGSVGKCNFETQCWLLSRSTLLLWEWICCDTYREICWWFYTRFTSQYFFAGGSALCSSGSMNCIQYWSFWWHLNHHVYFCMLVWFGFVAFVWCGLCSHAFAVCPDWEKDG